VFFAGIDTLSFRNAAADVIWVSEFVEGRIVRCLEVIVYEPSLFLLFKREVMAFQLGDEVQIQLFLAFTYLVVPVDYILSLCFWDCILLTWLRPNCQVGALKHGKDFLAVCCWTSYFRLRVNLWSVQTLHAFHALILFHTTEGELCLCHASFEFFPGVLLLLIERNPVGRELWLISWADSPLFVSEGEVRFSEIKTCLLSILLPDLIYVGFGCRQVGTLLSVEGALVYALWKTDWSGVEAVRAAVGCREPVWSSFNASMVNLYVGLGCPHLSTINFESRIHLSLSRVRYVFTEFVCVCSELEVALTYVFSVHVCFFLAQGYTA